MRNLPNPQIVCVAQHANGGVTAACGPQADPAVREVTLDIPRRGHLAIVGRSGAGKTTPLSLILRFLEPQGGRIELDGRPYAAWSHADVRDRLAYACCCSTRPTAQLDGLTEAAIHDCIRARAETRAVSRSRTGSRR